MTGSSANLAQLMLPLQFNYQPQLNAAMTPHALASPVSPNPDIKIELDNSDLWRKFHQHTTEMIVNKTGRRMFPTLKFKITGLDPSTSYAVFLELAPLDECRYKYQSGRWLINGRADPLPQSSNGGRSRLYSHPDSPAPGHLWMRQAVSFHRVKLTNNILDPQGNVLLNSMHKYQPRLFILKLHDYFPTVPQMVACTSFPETAFVTVTAYQNNNIIQLKIDHNPFAKGFRENGLHIDRKRPASADSSQENRESSPVPTKRLCLDSSECAEESGNKSVIDNNDIPEIVPKFPASGSNCKNSDSDSSITSSPLSVAIPSGPPVFSPPAVSYRSPVKPTERASVSVANGFPGPFQPYPHFLTPPFSPAIAAAAARFTPFAPGPFLGMNRFGLGSPEAPMGLNSVNGGIFNRTNHMADQAQMLLAAAAGFQRQSFLPNLGMYLPKV